MYLGKDKIGIISDELESSVKLLEYYVSEVSKININLKNAFDIIESNYKTNNYDIVLETNNLNNKNLTTMLKNYQNSITILNNTISKYHDVYIKNISNIEKLNNNILNFENFNNDK